MAVNGEQSWLETILRVVRPFSTRVARCIRHNSGGDKKHELRYVLISSLVSVARSGVGTPNVNTAVFSAVDEKT